MRLANIGRAFRYRNFRLFFIGQGTSLVGMWMQHVAMSWLVYSLSGSTAMLGVTLFLSQIPSLFISPFVGEVVDRLNRVRVYAVCQVLAMVEASFLAFLAFSGLVEVWHIMALSFLLGIVTAFDMSARQALTVQLVDRREDLPNAIAMSAAMFNGSRLIGPALAGLVLSWSSAAVCFTLNAISFLAVLEALRRMELPSRASRSLRGGLMRGVKDGIEYVVRTHPLRNILLLVSVCSLGLGLQSALLPAYTADLLKRDADVFGWLGAVTGLGALLSSLWLASRQSIAGLGLWIGGGLCLMGLGLVVAPHVQGVPLALVAFFLIGLGMVAHLGASNTVIQALVEEDKRGRLMSFYTMAVLGVAPISSYGSGLLAEKIGLEKTFAAGGLFCLISGGLFLWALPKMRGHVRSIYEKNGVVEPVP